MSWPLCELWPQTICLRPLIIHIHLQSLNKGPDQNSTSAAHPAARIFPTPFLTENRTAGRSVLLIPRRPSFPLQALLAHLSQSASPCCQPDCSSLPTRLPLGWHSLPLPKKPAHPASERNAVTSMAGKSLLSRFCRTGSENKTREQSGKRRPNPARSAGITEETLGRALAVALDHMGSEEPTHPPERLRGRGRFTSVPWASGTARAVDSCVDNGVDTYPKHHGAATDSRDLTAGLQCTRTGAESSALCPHQNRNMVDFASVGIMSSEPGSRRSGDSGPAWGRQSSKGPTGP